MRARLWDLRPVPTCISIHAGGLTRLFRKMIGYCNSLVWSTKRNQTQDSILRAAAVIDTTFDDMYVRLQLKVHMQMSI